MLKSRDYELGWWCPFIGFKLIFHYKRITKEYAFKYYGDYKGNLVLQVVANLFTWLFSCIQYEDYDYMDNIFIYDWTLCVLGFYVGITEYYYDFNNE